MQLIDQMSKSDTIRNVRLNFNHLCHALDDFFKVNMVVIGNFEISNELREESKLHGLGTSLRYLSHTFVMLGGIAHINGGSFNVIWVIFQFSLGSCK